MPTYVFQSYPATAKATFTCVSCGKANRTRSFRVECTVNPFNKNEDGTVKTPREVRQESFAKAAAQREQFLRKPLCKACEDALSYAERKAINEFRSAA